MEIWSFIGILLLIGVVLYILGLMLPFILIVIIIYLVWKLILFIRKERYFKSEVFQLQKQNIMDTANEFNEIARYVEEIPNKNKFVPSNKTGEHAHLATFENTSKHNYTRDKYKKTLNDDTVYSASLQVVRKASEEPIKYLCKYFNIKANEEDLNQIEEIGNNISRLESTLENLELRRERIENEFNPPKFILKYYRDELMERLDIEIPHVEVEYIEYVFEYVSAGGNSSQKTTITFDGETVEAVAKYLDERIKYKKSVKAQRSLMTNTLRTKIKERDNYTCQYCGASTEEQDLLLLEIDHIIPVSKGGLTSPDNLQTLCWKCNRSKSNKIL